jgi:uncharacterized membrane protein YeaQ/YmgE (transglycosylase-associated protein family)
MDELCKYANRPFAFIGRYLRRRRIAHLAILIAVVGAVIVVLVVGTLSGSRRGRGTI